MGTFFHSDGNPLFTTSQFGNFQNSGTDPYSAYKQQLLDNYAQQLQQQNSPQSASQSQRDYLNELDALTRGLDQEILKRLESNDKYCELKAQLQSGIQEEIMNVVKSKINSNTVLTENIKEEIEIINRVKNEVKSEERKNYYEMQDYLKNYSHLTFDEYKKLKSRKETSNASRRAETEINEFCEEND